MVGLVVVIDGIGVCVCVCVCVCLFVCVCVGSPQAPRALLRPLLRGPFGIPGVKGRQEFGGTNPWPLGVENYEEYEGRGSPQAPRALLRLVLRSSFGSPGVQGRQEFGETKTWPLGVCLVPEDTHPL